MNNLLYSRIVLNYGLIFSRDFRDHISVVWKERPDGSVYLARFTIEDFLKSLDKLDLVPDLL